MNLFRLSNDPIEAAQLNQDLHVKKICLEAAQLIANCYSPKQLQSAPRTQTGNIRKYSHLHHPISHYVRRTKGNFSWALKHAVALCEEFKYRFGKEHFCQGFIEWAARNEPELVKDGPEEEFPQCFKAHPDCIVSGNPVAGYKNYYRKAKMTFDIRGKIVEASWTKRPKPSFLHS